MTTIFDRFEKNWNTCQWSEKDGLHPEAFYCAPSEDGDIPTYDEENIKSFLHSELSRIGKRLMDDGPSLIWDRDISDYDEGFNAALLASKESIRKILEDEGIIIKE